jgi:hypothetical protein
MATITSVLSLHTDGAAPVVSTSTREVADADATLRAEELGSRLAGMHTRFTSDGNVLIVTSDDFVLTHTRTA